MKLMLMLINQVVEMCRDGYYPVIHYEYSDQMFYLAYYCPSSCEPDTPWGKFRWEYVGNKVWVLRHGPRSIYDDIPF